MRFFAPGFDLYLITLIDEPGVDIVKMCIAKIKVLRLAKVKSPNRTDRQI